MCMRHIVSCGLPGSTIFFHFISNTARFSKKKKVFENAVWVLIFSTTFVWNISHSKKKWARYCHKCTQVFMSDRVFSTDCRKILKYQLTNERPTWCHLLFYFTYYVLNMFRTLIYPSSGACDCVHELPHRSSCSQFVVCWSFCCGWYLVVFVLQAEAQVVK